MLDWLFDVLRALLVAMPIVLLLCAPAYGLRFFLVVLAHTIVAAMLLASWRLGTIGLMVDCGSGSDAKTCAWVTALLLAAPILLTAQLLVGLGSLLGKWSPMRRVGRFGSVVAALGLSLLLYGWFGPAEAFLPPAPPQ